MTRIYTVTRVKEIVNLPMGMQILAILPSGAIRVAVK